MNIFNQNPLDPVVLLDTDTEPRKHFKMKILTMLNALKYVSPDTQDDRVMSWIIEGDYFKVTRFDSVKIYGLIYDKKAGEFYIKLFKENMKDIYFERLYDDAWVPVILNLYECMDKKFDLSKY